MMKWLPIILCMVVMAVTALSIDQELSIAEEWEGFKMRYNKNYTCEKENKLRMEIYARNKQKIAAHNLRYQRGLETFTLGENTFSDMLDDEFASTMLGYRTLANGKWKLALSTYIPPANVLLPSHVDWRTEGAVTNVKNQGRCGSCWAFSATGSIEGQHFRKTGDLVPLSEQNLVDCSLNFGNFGCHGGDQKRAFEYVEDNGGIDAETTYPYNASDSSCRYKEKSIAATVTGIMSILPKEHHLKAAVATVGPISVAIDASLDTFRSYQGGVYYDARCSTKKLRHAVLVVGYGTDRIYGDYWLVKNSWGYEWGDSGYIKMARNRDNVCGIASDASYPLV